MRDACGSRRTDCAVGSGQGDCHPRHSAQDNQHGMSLPDHLQKLYIDIYQDSFEHLTSFAGASNNGEGRLSYRGGVACQQEYLYPGVQLVEDHLGHQHFHFLQFSLCGKAL